MAKSIDLYIDQGSDFTAQLPPVLQANGTVLNLTGYTVESMLRRSYTTRYAVEFVATITNAAQGLITLTLSAAETAGLQTSALHTSRWVYDVVITAPNDKVTRVFEGIAIINPSVSAKPGTILLTPYVPEDYGGL